MFVLEMLQYALHQFTQKCKVEKFEFSCIVRIQLLLQVQGLLDQKGVLDFGEPHYQHYFPEEWVETSGSAKPTTMGVLGKAHWIHVVVNNH
jgi:hypothetical protein